MSLSRAAVPPEPSNPSAQASAQPQAQQQIPSSNLGANRQIAAAQPINDATALPRLSATTEQILRRINANGGAQPALQAAREQVLQQMVTTQNVSAPKQPPPPRRGSGRGRGRGGGSSGTKVEKPRRESAATAGSPTNPGRGRGSGRARGGGRGGRRRRVKKEEVEYDDEDETSDHTTSSETFTSLPTTTKSGRAINRPTQYDPATKTPTRRRGPYRRMAEASVCRVCQRGHSPSRNLIVFCDGCNTPYHQYCHDPPVEDEVVKVEEKEWLCSYCTGSRQTAPTGGLGEAELRTAVGGERLSLEERRAYFLRLPHASLVSLLLHATSLQPTLPLFLPNAEALLSPISAVQCRAPSLAAANFKSTEIVPGTSGYNASQGEDRQMSDMTSSRGQAAAPPATGSLGDITFASHHSLSNTSTANKLLPPAPLPPATPHDLHLQQPLHVPYQHYPKSGNGIRLPPLTDEDLAWLVDDDFVSFTHLYHGQPVTDLDGHIQPVGLSPEPAAGAPVSSDGALNQHRTVDGGQQQMTTNVDPTEQEKDVGGGREMYAHHATAA